MKLRFWANQVYVISCHLRLIYVFIFQQTTSILNSLHSFITPHCVHGIHYYCKLTFFKLGVYSPYITLLSGTAI